MSNITLTMPADVIHQAKIMAAQRDTSVSGLVARLLMSAAGQDLSDEAVWDREEEAMRAGTMRVGAITWSRDEVHTR